MLKNYICLILFILSLPMLSIFGQNPEGNTKPDEECTQPIVCPPKPYPYYFCNGKGKVIVSCSIDPNDNPDEWTKDEYNQPLRINLPICLVFEDSGPDLVKVSGCTETMCYEPRPVYRKSDMLSQLQQTQKRINCLCNKENDSFSCSIKVRFSEQRIDFKYPNTQLSTSSIKLYKTNDINVLNSDCSVNCENSEILLNNTEEFTLKSYRENNEYSQFYVIDDYFYSDPTLESFISLRAYNLIDVLNYELGSLLGLGIPRGVTSGDFNDCNYEGIFNGEPNSFKSKNMSDDDKCMIINKYCNPLSINEIVNLDNYNLYINDGQLNITFTNDKLINKVEIYSNTGNLVLSSNQDNLIQGYNNIKIDINNLIQGYYLITLYENNGNINTASFIYLK